MSKKANVVISVYNNTCCDLVLYDVSSSYTPSLMFHNLHDLMQDALNQKMKDPAVDIEKIWRPVLASPSEKFWLDFNILNTYSNLPQDCCLVHFLGLVGCLLGDVYLCDFRVDEYRVPELFMSSSVCFYDDSEINLEEETIDELISTVRCCQIGESFKDIHVYSIKDETVKTKDEMIKTKDEIIKHDIILISIGNFDYFKTLAYNYVKDDSYFLHKIYVYEHKDGKSEKVYGCFRLSVDNNEDIDVIDIDNDCISNKNSTLCNIVSSPSIKCSEVINIVDSGNFLSLKELPLDSLEVVDIQREPTYHSEDHNLFYDIVTKIYRCSDGFVGVRGVYRVNTEDFGLGILNIKCSASEYKETKVTVFVKK